MIQVQNLGNLGGKKVFFPWGWSRNGPFSHFQREKTGKDPGWEMKYWIIPDFPSILFPFYIHLFQRLSSGNGGLGFFPKEQPEKAAPSCSRWENWDNSSLERGALLGSHPWNSPNLRSGTQLDLPLEFPPQFLYPKGQRGLGDFWECLNPRKTSQNSQSWDQPPPNDLSQPEREIQGNSSWEFFICWSTYGSSGCLSSIKTR